MRVKLEDVCERGTSSLMQKDIVDKNGKYPVYGASGRIGSMETYQQEHQTVAVVKDGAGIGRTMLLPEKSSVIGTMQYLIPKNCIESEYLYYVVKYMHLEKYFSGATIPHIYFRDYKTEEFNLHDKTEQREIVSTLKRIEAIISNRQEQLTKLDELVKARFVEMFGDPDQNPKGWPLVSITEIIRDKASNGFFAKRDAYKDDGNVQILGVSNVVNRMYSNTKELPRTDATQAEKEKYSVKYGDMLFCRSSLVADGIGKASIVAKGTFPNVLFECHVIRLSLDLQKCVPEFVQVLSTTPFFRRQIIAQSKTATMTTIGQDGILKSSVVLPPIDLQNQFADFVAEVDKSKLFAELFAQSTCILAENRSK